MSSYLVIHSHLQLNDLCENRKILCEEALPDGWLVFCKREKQRDRVHQFVLVLVSAEGCGLSYRSY
jgi:hypothetical protein